MGLRDIESTLPPGFRFYPSDEELICHYLYKKVCNEGVSGGTMVEVDLHSREPWELPEGAKLSTDEWYFFSFRDRKYSTGSRANRATKSGYWKATGKDRTIYDPSSHAVVGMRKTLVFYGGRAPNGIKSNWVMHEFRLENPYATPAKEDWVLCRVFHKKKGEELDTNMSSCPSPTMESSSPRQMVDNPLQEGISYRDVVGSSLAPYQDDHNCTTSFQQLEMDNFLHCNFQLHQLPQQQLEVMNNTLLSRGIRDDHFGIYLDGIHEEEGAGFGNLRDFRFQGDKDRLYYQ